MQGGGVLKGSYIGDDGKEHGNYYLGFRGTTMGY